MLKVTGNLAKGQAGSAAALGTMDALSDRSFLRRVSSAVRANAEGAFNVYMDNAASANPRALHHVYEWGQLGDPDGRLFKIVWKGNQHGTTMRAEFLPSTKPVPRPTDYPQDTRSRQHIFQWKAAVMEEGMTVTIAPKDSDVLVWPARQGGMAFTEDAIEVFVGQWNMGQFSSRWNTFFNENERTFAAEAVTPVTKTLRTYAPRAIQREAARATPDTRGMGAQGIVRNKVGKELVRKFIDGLGWRY